MANPIVTVQVSQTVAPTPSNLQKTGAIISSGGTTLSQGATQLLLSDADLNAILPAALALTTVAWAAGVVTASTAAPHGKATGATFVSTIAGVTPSGFNGTFNCIATGPSAFTYYVAANPGLQTVAGTYSNPAGEQVNAMVDTFFGQGSQQGVYVLELGSGSVATQVSNLQNFINNSDQMFYSYLVPREWDADPAFLALIAQYETTTAKTYFFVTTTLATYSQYTAQMKDVVALIEAPQYGIWPGVTFASATWAGGTVTAATTTAHGIKPGDWFQTIGMAPAGYNGIWRALPGTTGTALSWAMSNPGGPATTPGSVKQSVYGSVGIPATEFTMAAAWWVTLNYAPGAANKVPPYAYSYLYGVTRFPSPGNGPLFSALKLANVNIVGTGAEGGIGNNILIYGHTMDGRPWNYWYSVDWMQINIDLDISNAIINGSNNFINPLYYNQDGINRLEAVAANTGTNGIAYGLALGAVRQVSLDPAVFTDNINKGVYAGLLVVNAIPFPSYTAAHPSHYAIGEYDGLSMVYTPLRGFEHIVFNIVVTDFVAAAA
jgi:hypothetical protein